MAHNNIDISIPFFRKAGRLGGGGSSAFSPSSVPNIHAWWDPSDIAGLRQLSGGTVSVAANDPVGYMPDKSGNGRHMLQATGAARPILRGTPTGAELCTEGNFTTPTVWTANAGWTLGAGVATAATASTSLDYEAIVPAGTELYMVTYDIPTYVSGTVQMSIGGTAGATRSAAGTYTEWIQAVSSGILNFLGASFVGTIDNVSVKRAEAANVAAPYWLQLDEIADEIATAALTSKVAPLYFISACRHNSNSLNKSDITLFADATNYIASMFRSTDRHGTDSISATAGSVFAVSGNNQVPSATSYVAESIVTVGTTKGKVDNNTEYSAANTWIAGTTLTTPQFGLFDYGGPGGIPATNRFYGGALVLADPSAGDRASLRTYFGAKQGRSI